MLPIGAVSNEPKDEPKDELTDEPMEEPSHQFWIAARPDM